ncbi:MAG TPA: TonB family protein, partial [Bryobacteraceae bacterium]|nr:TonB family protein [Bryobacteraceae bacterium]
MDVAGFLIRSSALAVLAGGALAIFRMKSAAARHAVWTAVVFGMLLLPALRTLLPVIPVRLLKATQAPPRAALSGAPLVRYEAPAPPVTNSPGRRFTWRDAAIWAYAFAVLWLLLRLAFSYLFTRRLVRASRRIEDDRYESAWISAPLTVGVIRPKILLPLEWRDWEGAKLEAVLAHERSHIRRCDWGIAMLAAVNRCLFWFHPLAWWLERHLSNLAEHACDDAALLETGTRDCYAQTLLDMAAAVKNREGRLVWEAMAMAKAAEVRKRIERVLDENRRIPRGLTLLRWAALAACSGPIIYLAAVAHLAPARAQEPAAAVSLPMGRLGDRHHVNAGNVSELEARLAGDPHNVDLRGELALYYFSISQREPRLSHIFWLIANHPESEQAGYLSTGILPRTTNLNDRADYDRAASLWRQQAASHPADRRVLMNAATFFMQAGGDPSEAEQLLKQGSALEPQNFAWKEALAKLYTSAILAAAGDPAIPSANPEFAPHARAELENSRDANLVGTAANQLRVARRPGAQDDSPVPVRTGRKGSRPPALNLDEHPLLVPVVELGQQLAERFRQISPAPAPAAPVPTPVASATPPPAENPVNAPTLLQRVHPVYPPLALQARVSGIVQLEVTVGADGHVKNIRAIPGKGHPLLIQAAMDAVRQWIFAPVSAPATFTVMVPFALPASTTPAPARIGGFEPNGLPQPGVGVQVSPGRIRLGGDVLLAKLESRVDPVYPATARQAGIQGDVHLDVIIGTDGRVKNISVVDGNPVLVGAAEDAVRQWVFRPTTLDGEP